MSDILINPQEIGTRIRNLRKKKNKSQNYLADVIFISPSYLALIEAGKRTPNLETLSHIADEMDVSVDYLLFGEDKTLNTNLQTFKRLSSIYSEEEIRRALRLAEYYLKLSRLKNADDDIKL